MSIFVFVKLIRQTSRKQTETPRKRKSRKKHRTLAIKLLTGFNTCTNMFLFPATPSPLLPNSPYDFFALPTNIIFAVCFFSYRIVITVA